VQYAYHYVLCLALVTLILMPSQCRVILENAAVRAAAVSSLNHFAANVPSLRASISVLLKRSVNDEDDEV
jgi:hypothetical protein